MKKILVIEDEFSYLKLLEIELQSHGYEVIKANDGRKGLELAKKLHPDLILLDIRMPEMDGMTVLQELRKDEYGRTAKVILLTNLEPSDDMIKNVIIGKPSYYFVKSDIKLSDLLEKVAELLSA